MRLEIEPTLAAPHLADDDLGGNGAVDSAEAKSALNQGIKAAQAGNRAQARAALVRATEIDPGNESAWLWLASISEYPEELLGFLNHVLDINPSNQRAIEWKAATNTLLSRTFVQRGIDAVQENQREFAGECFQTALEYDVRNATAWMWMASLADTNAVRINLLENALAIEPDNEAALDALEDAKRSVLKDRMADARTAAVSGDNAEATRILDALLITNPESVEAWTMKSHLAEGFDEKVRCFERILVIDPDNIAARAGRDSLLALFGSQDAEPPVDSSDDEAVVASNDTAVEDAGEAVLSSYDAAPDNASEVLAVEIEPTVIPYPNEDLDALSAFESADSPYATRIERPSENEYESESMEFGAEPSDPVTTEAQESPAADSFAEQLAPANGTNVLSFVPPRKEPIEFDQAYAEASAETVVFSYQDDDPIEAGVVGAVPDDVWTPASAPEIPMPSSDLPEADNHLEAAAPTVLDTVELIMARPESVDCPFCANANEPQDYTCHACMAVLTLSDLELLLANQQADKSVLRQSVEEMERRRLSQDFSSLELITLGLGHLNLRNLQLGYSCLQEASRLDPNNVVLSGQVNSLLIRLEEIKQQEEVHLKMPKGKSILVVDDSPTVRKLIAGKLEKCGHDVICASDGVEAMERLDHFIPDLILLDITMPRMDGYQVCKTIRSNSSTKDVPVVMISGKDGFFDKVRGRMAGTTGYITKPFGPETLMKAVEMYLSGEIPESEEV